MHLIAIYFHSGLVLGGQNKVNTFNHPKLHHYVPQLILKNFCAAGKQRIFVFDKLHDHVFQTNIKNAAAENGFYNIEENEFVISVEPSLGKIESAAASIIDKIIRKESLANLTEDERYKLSLFVAAQFARVKQSRQIMRDLNDSLLEVIRTMGLDPNNVDGFELADDLDIKKSAILTLPKRILEYTPHFYDKAWILFKAPKSAPHYISDNPVTLQNMYDFGPYGNLGLAVHGIEIYFPLSSKLSLGMFCHTHEKMIRNSFRQYMGMKKVGLLHVLEMESDTIADLKKLKYGLETGNAIKSTGENIVNLNSLQVIFSSRFICSADGNFDLAREMIRANPSYAKAPKMIST